MPATELVLGVIADLDDDYKHKEVMEHNYADRIVL